MRHALYKVLIVGLSEHRCGVEGYIMNMVRNLPSDVFECYFPRNGAEKTYGDGIRSLGGHFIEVSRVRGIHFLQYYAGWWKVLRRYRFDVIYWNDCSIVSLDVLRMARWLGVPVRIFHAHNSSMDTPLSGLRRWIEKKNFQCLPDIANLLLACSETAAQWMFRAGARYQVVPNALDVFRYQFSDGVRSKKRNELGVSDRHVIGFVGRLTPQKYPEFYVQVAAALCRQSSRCFLIMVGAGELESEVRQVAEGLGLTPSQFLMLGARSDVPELLQALDCLVMPSRYEGLPMTLVEAQASGLPCVVSDTISRECDLTGDVTFLSLKDPVKHWADVILQRLQEPRDRTQGARKVREAGFDAADAFPKLEQLILDKLRENKN